MKSLETKRPTKKIRIGRLNDSESDIKWDKYVEWSSHATFFHLSGWKRVLEKTFGYEAHYLYADDHEKICGVLPLMRVRSLLSGTALISLPFSVYGGIAADDEEVEDLLLEEAKHVALENNANYLELRNKTARDGMPTKNLYWTFIKELPVAARECLAMLPRKARAAARKGGNSGLEAISGQNLVKEFFDIYAISVRNLGSPVFSKDYLENLIEEFPDNIMVLVVRHDGQPIAAVFTLLYKDTVSPYYSGSLPQYFSLQPNNFMYLKLMEFAVENGYRYFDFGRSKKGTGAFDFKKNQGFDPQPLYYQYVLNGTSEIPDASPLNPKVRAMVEVWKRLPVPITKLIGPQVIRFTPP